MENLFLLNAALVGMFTAISSSLIGNFLVAKRQAMLSDMLSHCAILGVSLGYFLNLNPLNFAILTSLISAFILNKLTKGNKRPKEAISVMIFNGALALAYVFSHLAKDLSFNFETFLFGSILSISNTEIILSGILCLCTILIVCINYKKLIAITFDRDYAISQGFNVNFFETLFIFLASLLIGINLKIIGGLLISAFLIIPVLCASNFCKNFKQNIKFSCVFSISSVLIGLLTSYFFDIPSSSAIVLSLILIFGITSLKRVN